MTLAQGTQLGPYQIQTALGKGGMGEVYRATDMRLHRDVAVKVLPEHLLENITARNRFEREARALAALSHPNILTIFDVGSEQGLFFVVTELLKGQPLRNFIPPDGLSWQEAVRIALLIADGLAAAHSQGVIHRDLKPENIFISSEGVLKILDFGLAFFTSTIPDQELTAAETVSRMTQSNAPVMGTIPYMSPEQVRGGKVDGRTDIFSFGCVLYEMLSGSRAFRRNSAAETVAAILKEEPSPIVKDVPPALRAILHHCLEKASEKRFQTARDLAFNLRDVTATPHTQTTKIALRSDSRTIRISVATTLLVILVAAGFFYIRFHTGRTINTLAVLPFINADKDPDLDFLSDGITDRIISSLSQLPQLRVMARSAIFSYNGKETNPREVGKKLGVGAVFTGTMMLRGDNVVIHAELVDTKDGFQIWGEEYNRTLSDILPLQEEIAKKIAENLQLILTPDQSRKLSKPSTENRQAYQLYLKGRYYWNKRSQEGFKKAKDYFLQAIDQDPNYALAFAGLADYYSQPGYNMLAPQEAYPKAIAAAQKALDLDPSLAEPHIVLAQIQYQYKKDPVSAEKEFKKGIALNPNYATGHQWYSLLLSTMGRHSEAAAEMKEAMELDPLSLMIQTTLGDILRHARKYDEAIIQYRKAMEMDANFAQSHMNLGMLYELQGNQDEAIKENLIGMRLAKNPYSEETAQIYKTSGWRGVWQTELDFQLNMLEEKQPVDPLRLTRIYLILGEKEKAMDWLEKYSVENKSDHTFPYDLQVDPMYDPIRSNPRFSALLKRVLATSN